MLDVSKHALSVLETSVDAIITIDRVGTMLIVNSAAERLFQYDRADLIGSPIAKLMPEPDRSQHPQYIDRFLNTGEARIIGIGREVVGKKADGTLFPLELSVSQLDLDGEIYFTGVMRDITKRRNLELEVLRISDFERQRIGQDLHDGLGQMLTGISLITQHLARKLDQQSNALANEANEIVSHLQEADRFARALSRTLVPIPVDEKGLKRTFQTLCSQIGRLYDVTCNFLADESAFTHVERIPRAATNIYRIIQEATTNAVRHGGASKITISLRENSQGIQLTIRDNGKGFSGDEDQSNGLGIQSMRYRAHVLGGKLRIDRLEAQGGVSIVVTIPRWVSPQGPQ